MCHPSTQATHTHTAQLLLPETFTVRPLPPPFKHQAKCAGWTLLGQHAGGAGQGGEPRPNVCAHQAQHSLKRREYLWNGNRVECDDVSQHKSKRNEDLWHQLRAEQGR